MNRKERRIDIAAGAVLWLLTVVVIIPLMLLVFTAFKTREEAQIQTLTLPVKWQWSNLQTVLEKGLLLQGFRNSFIITIPCVLLIMVTAALAGYYLARQTSRLARFFYYFLVAGIIKPIPLVTTYRLLQQLHLINRFSGVILVLAGTLVSMAAFIYTGFMKGIPRELDEAARIDGATPVQTFFHIILPLLKPCNATVLVLMFLNVWNDGQAALFFLGDSDYWTVPLSIYRFFGYFRNDWNYIFCCILLSTLPVLIVYIFSQRYIIDGMISGSVKG